MGFHARQYAIRLTHCGGSVERQNPMRKVNCLIKGLSRRGWRERQHQAEGAASGNRAATGVRKPGSTAPPSSSSVAVRPRT